MAFYSFFPFHIASFNRIFWVNLAASTDRTKVWLFDYLIFCEDNHRAAYLRHIWATIPWSMVLPQDRRSTSLIRTRSHILCSTSERSCCITGRATIVSPGTIRDRWHRLVILDVCQGPVISFHAWLEFSICVCPQLPEWRWVFEWYRVYFF